jgi:hypothetical protein
VKSKRAVRLGADLQNIRVTGRERVFVVLLYVGEVRRSVRNDVAAVKECSPSLVVGDLWGRELNVEF